MKKWLKLLYGEGKISFKDFCYLLFVVLKYIYTEFVLHADVRDVDLFQLIEKEKR